MFESLKTIWKREPARVVFIVVGAGFLVYQGVKSGVGWEEAISAAVAWAGVEIVRSQVTPVSSSK